MQNGKVAPTSTCAQARVRLYQPSQRPSVREGDWMETSFGRCRVTGRLGQRHADLLESILCNAEKRRDIEDGGVELLVDPARVRKTISNSRYSSGQIQKLLSELRAATIEIETRELMHSCDRIIGGLVDHVTPSSTITRRDPLTGGERPLWIVRLGVALVMLLKHDLTLYYDPAPIARLTHGISQAVARHIHTHKHDPAGGWKTETLIRAVLGTTASNQTIRNARRRLRDDEKGLRKIGIEIDGDRMKRATSARQRATPARQRAIPAR